MRIQEMKHAYSKRVKQHLKEKEERKKKELIDNFCLADMAIEVAKIAIITGVKGTNFKNKKMVPKLERIEKLLEDMQKSEIGQAVRLDPDKVDVMQNEHALELYRLLSLMGFYPTDHLTEFNDGIELMHKQQDNENK